MIMAHELNARAEAKTRARLESKVRAVNRANHAANVLYEKLRLFFAPLVGQQVCNGASGSLKAKFREPIAKLLMVDTTCLRTTPEHWAHSLRWIVSANDVDPGTSLAQYADAQVHVGNTRNGILTELAEPPKLRSDYTPAEVLALRADYDRAKSDLNRAQNALEPFGEYDR